MEILTIIVSALAGGGLWHIITWRLRKRKLKGDVSTEQYRQFESIVDSYIDKMGQMSEKIVKLQEENMELRQQIILQLQQKHDEHRDSTKNPGA